MNMFHGDLLVYLEDTPKNGILFLLTPKSVWAKSQNWTLPLRGGSKMQNPRSGPSLWLFFTAEILNLDCFFFKGHFGVRIPGYEFHCHLRGDRFFLRGKVAIKTAYRQIYSPLCKKTKVGMEIIQPGSIGDISRP